LNFDEGNAFKFFHFEGFSYNSKPATVKKKIRSTLNARLKEELEYANSIDILGKSENGVYQNRHIDDSYLTEREADLEIGEDITGDTDTKALYKTVADFMINSMSGVIESEKVFFADPAFFNGVEDLYKRWSGAGSTGDAAAATTDAFPDNTFNVVTLNTQEFSSDYLGDIRDRQAELYEKFFDVSKEEAWL